jgi:hypothetical protein
VQLCVRTHFDIPSPPSTPLTPRRKRQPSVAHMLNRASNTTPSDHQRAGAAFAERSKGLVSGSPSGPPVASLSCSELGSKPWSARVQVPPPCRLQWLRPQSHCGPGRSWRPDRVGLSCSDGMALLGLQLERQRAGACRRMTGGMPLRRSRAPPACGFGRRRGRTVSPSPSPPSARGAPAGRHQ